MNKQINSRLTLKHDIEGNWNKASNFIPLEGEMIVYDADIDKSWQDSEGYHEGGTHKLPISEIKVDYSTPWLIQHQRAIVSAYRTSAYFEYYQDELFAIMDSRPERLIDLNTAILEFFIRKTGLMVDLRMTGEYSPEGIAGGVVCEDLRETIHPKRTNTVLQDLGLEKPYFQVFARKYGFKPDLSVMDLLFNEGPDSILYLKNL